MSLAIILPKSGGYLNITAAKIAEWQEKFPGVNVEEEVREANVWLSHNKSKEWKTLQGFQSWLAKSFTNKHVNRQTTPWQESAVEKVEQRAQAMLDSSPSAPRDVGLAALRECKRILK